MTAEKEKYRILLADDHVLIGHGIKNIIENDDKFYVVGEVNNGKELIDFLKTSEVEIIILDISMPGSGGMEAIGVIKRAYPLIKILMLTMHKNKEYFYKAMSAGAAGYLMKNDSDEELLVALEKILSGKNYISPYMIDDLAEDMLSMFRNEKKPPSKTMTKREKEILQLVVQGNTSKKIAKQLNLSQRTIDHHRSNLLRKFNRKNSVDLVNYVVRNGFVSFD